MTTTNQTATLLGIEPSFGFGDRIGLATPGHVLAMKQAGNGILPIFPQQSIREMARTVREPDAVMADALRAAHSAGWDGPIGADADHLKTHDDVDRTAAAGFTFFTIDPSDHVDEQADTYDAATLNTKFDAVKGDIEWYDRYLGREVTLPNDTTIRFDEEACKRCAVKYGRAIVEACNLAAYIDQAHEKLGRGYEIELSVDETDQPTTLAEHYIVADQCLSHGMKLVSLAPRFIGELEKGVDYIGDITALEASLADHNAIAKALGPYKLSLHSGSDKVSMYPALARATQGRFHVKTAGTSYLEALRVVARHDENLFRQVVTFARGRYDTDKATYHVHATVAGTPTPESLPDAVSLEREYLELWDEVPEGKGFTKPGRQVLHCTFGSVLTDPTLGQAVRSVLESHPETYEAVLADHFARHLNALREGM
ncbi:tagaturonate epimerase family protein [Phycisphaeraceae bacterium D3-23]